MDSENQDYTYKKISAMADDWFELHKGETFTLSGICQDLVIRRRENRRRVAEKLNYEAEQCRLEKNGRFFRLIDKTIDVIEWWGAPESTLIDLKWPRGHSDNTGFGFDGYIQIYEGDIVVIAGASNQGKTAFCLNLMVENMDQYPCTLMGNEYVAGKFRDRIQRFDWVELFNGELPKFELIKRRDNWQDIIRPNNINIIDWINLAGDRTYDIGKIIEGIQSKLVGGIAVISIQKNPGADWGRGGSFTEDLASVYFTIDYQKLLVKKAKSWEGLNPNNKKYAFKIGEKGTNFYGIHEILG